MRNLGDVIRARHARDAGSRDTRGSRAVRRHARHRRFRCRRMHQTAVLHTAVRRENHDETPTSRRLSPKKEKVSFDFFFSFCVFEFQRIQKRKLSLSGESRSLFSLHCAVTRSICAPCPLSHKNYQYQHFISSTQKKKNIYIYI